MTKAILLGLLAVAAWGQTDTATITMPTYVGGGVVVDQTSPNLVKPFVFTAIPVSQSAGVYVSTAADLLYSTKPDPVAGRPVYVFNPQFRGGVYKTVYTGTKMQLMAGGDGGGAFSSQAGGLSVNLAASVTGIVAYQINSHWAVIVPIRALYTASLGGWHLVPELAVVWKPGASSRP